jgi:hypothetical protein
MTMSTSFSPVIGEIGLLWFSPDLSEHAGELPVSLPSFSPFLHRILAVYSLFPT